MTNYLPSAEPCSVGTFVTVFVKYYVNQIDTCTVFFPDAIASWNIFIKHFDGVRRLLTPLRNILIHFIVPALKVFSVYMIL